MICLRVFHNFRTHGSMKNLRCPHTFGALLLALAIAAGVGVQGVQVGASPRNSAHDRVGRASSLCPHRVQGAGQQSGSCVEPDRCPGQRRVVLGCGLSVLHQLRQRSKRQRTRLWLPQNCCGGGDRAFPGLAVAPNGRVWGVLNHSLIELNPATGRFSISSLPSPAGTNGEPTTDLNLSQNSADLVAISPNGKEMVVGFEYADAIAVFGLHDSAILPQPSMIALPTGYIALDMAILADGTIGIGMERFGSRSDSEIDILRTNSSATRVRVTNGWGVAADGAGFLVGDLSPAFVSESGRVLPVPASFVLPKGATWGANAGDSGPDPLSVVPGGVLVRPIDRGELEDRVTGPGCAFRHAPSALSERGTELRWVRPQLDNDDPRATAGVGLGARPGRTDRSRRQR